MLPDVHLASLAMSREHYSIPKSDAHESFEPTRLNNCNWILIYLLGSLGGFAAYSYAPCLPAIQADLGANEFWTSVALVANWVARGFGSFIVGYVSDYTGRKWMIFVGLQFIILGAYFCSETKYIFNFILTIMIQGIGEGSSSLVFPVICESYSVSEEEKYRLQGVVTTIQNFSLAIGPTIGGFITLSNGWRWVFRTIYLWATVCMFLTCFLPETNLREERKKTMYQICDDTCSHVGMQLRQLWWREYISGLLFFTFYNAIIYIFLSTLAFVFDDFYDIGSWESGLLISAIACGALCGSIVSVWGLGDPDAPAITHLSDLRWAFGFIGIPVGAGAIIVVVTQVYDKSGNNCWILSTVLGVMMFFLNSVTLSYRAIQHRRFQDKYGTSIGFSAMFTLTLALVIAVPFIAAYGNSPALILQSITIIYWVLWITFWVTMGVPGLPEGYWDLTDGNLKIESTVISEEVENNEPVITTLEKRNTW